MLQRTGLREEIRQGLRGAHRTKIWLIQSSEFSKLSILCWLVPLVETVLLVCVPTRLGR